MVVEMAVVERGAATVVGPLFWLRPAARQGHTQQDRRGRVSRTAAGGHRRGRIPLCTLTTSTQQTRSTKTACWCRQTNAACSFSLSVALLAPHYIVSPTIICVSPPAALVATVVLGVRQCSGSQVTHLARPPGVKYRRSQAPRPSNKIVVGHGG